jgi:hypothetical protein
VGSGMISETRLTKRHLPEVRELIVVPLGWARATAGPADIAGLFTVRSNVSNGFFTVYSPYKHLARNVLFPVICGADNLASHLSIKLQVQPSGEDFKDVMGGFNKGSKIIHRHSSNLEK